MYSFMYSSTYLLKPVALQTSHQFHCGISLTLVAANLIKLKPIGNSIGIENNYCGRTPSSMMLNCGLQVTITWSERQKL